MGNATSRAEMDTRHEAKTAKDRTKLKARREAYKLVDRRDKGLCRNCKARGEEHHHIRGRWVRDAESSGNIVLLCVPCHQLRHVKRTLTITGNADQVLTFAQGERVWFSPCP